jgi:hypothetical protein
MKDKSAEEIQNEIKALEACKDYAPRRTMFGDDNHRKIDLQIDALKGEIDTTTEEFNDYYNFDEQSTITEAIDWMNGQIEEAPSKGWDIFKPKEVALKRQECACQRQPSRKPKPGKKS